MQISKEEIERDRRFMAVPFPQNLLVTLLNGDIEARWKNLPLDAYVHNVSYDPLRDCIVVIFASASFRKVPFREIIPLQDNIELTATNRHAR